LDKGITIKMKIGKNAQENWKLFDKAGQTDVWFHLDKYPSAHLYLSAEEAKDEAKILEAAQLVKQKSKYKNWNRIKVVYTPKKNLRRGKEVGELLIVSHRKCEYVTV
jgi:predicted ribosome quality control (RQC) complex YloA/Tae2 family protein